MITLINYIIAIKTWARTRLNIFSFTDLKLIIISPNCYFRRSPLLHGLSSALKQNEASSKAKFRIGGMYSYELTNLFQILQTKKQDKQGTTSSGSKMKRCSLY